ncbi:tetratricopeptide repeat protein [Allosphingosinicella vermicomposti]|uniref:tetratricopeptide repeat protein n=1 Tax=Allosphingosinicella vermicomposti TaxID=614671 RepID=UPI000D0E666F|nr:tetratricopeptide repeat protein [Allosphingosinicella vermicomposti]
MKKLILPLILALSAGCSNETEVSNTVVRMPEETADAPALSPEEMEQIRQRAEANPSDDNAQQAYAAALLVSGKARDALAQLDRLAMTPERQRLKGDALFMAGDYREAAAAFRSAGAIGDTPARLDETLRIMGGGAMQSERWAEAAALYEELRGRGDNSAATLNNLAYSYAAIGKYDAAIPLARQALAGVPNDPAALDTLGWALVKSGRDKAEGLRLLEKAAALSPADEAIAAHVKMARAH